MSILDLVKSLIMNLKFRSALTFLGIVCVVDTFFPLISNVITLTVLFVGYLVVEIYRVNKKVFDYRYHRSVNKNVKSQEVIILFDDKTKKSYMLDGSIKNTSIRKFRMPLSYKADVLVDKSYFMKENAPYDTVFVREQRQYFRKVFNTKEGIK